MSSNLPSLETIQEEAARWVVRLNDNELSDLDREALQQWLLLDPRHANEFRAHNAMITLAAELTPQVQSRLSAAALLDEPTKVSRPSWIRQTAIAAAVLIAAITSGWFVFGPEMVRPALYETRTGETRTVTFEDGSVAYLNTRTKLRWTGSASDRRVHLSEGEALFDVVPDPARPFRVSLDNSEIKVVGTRFNVYRKKSGEVVLTVLEGKVVVEERSKDRADSTWQRLIAADQEITYGQLGLTSDVHQAVAADTVKWREGVIEIRDRPLAEVLDELTRYTDQRIVIRDPRIAELRIGGALNVRDVHAALARLEKLAPLRVVQNGDTLTLDYRNE